MKIVITSGFFNPLHKGHLAYFRNAKDLGDKHIVIVNTDEQVEIKGSVPFMDQAERADIINELKCVDHVLFSIDSGLPVIETLEAIVQLFGRHNDYIFANGGDRTKDNIPEIEVAEKYGIKLVFEVGGNNKLNSSSTLIANANGRK